MSKGRCPWIWLIAIAKVVNEDKLNIEEGIVPLNLLLPTPKNVSFVNWPKDSGIIPPKSFSPTENDSRNDKFPKECGILPIRLFL